VRSAIVTRERCSCRGRERSSRSKPWLALRANAGGSAPDARSPRLGALDSSPFAWIFARERLPNPPKRRMPCARHGHSGGGCPCGLLPRVRCGQHRHFSAGGERAPEVFAALAVVPAETTLLSSSCARGKQASIQGQCDWLSCLARQATARLARARSRDQDSARSGPLRGPKRLGTLSASSSARGTPCPLSTNT
jgi:hypothetical protein